MSLIQIQLSKLMITLLGPHLQDLLLINHCNVSVLNAYILFYHVFIDLINVVDVYFHFMTLLMLKVLVMSIILLSKSPFPLMQLFVMMHMNRLMFWTLVWLIFFCFLHLVFILITREEHKQILFLWKFSYPFFVFMSRSSFTTPGIIKKQNFEMSSVSPGEGQMQLFLWSCLLVLMETLFFKYFFYIVFIVTIFCRLPCHKEA